MKNREVNVLFSPPGFYSIKKIFIIQLFENQLSFSNFLFLFNFFFASIKNVCTFAPAFEKKKQPRWWNW